jgi:cytochrome P450 family 142 subfamily A polypeptide 1
MLCFRSIQGQAPRGHRVTAVTTESQINVLDPQFYVNPWDAYRWLQDEAPVFRDPAQQLWVISRYDDVRSVEKDGERFSSFNGSRPHIDQRADQSMINMDDPAHQVQRSLVLRRFTPRAVRTHEEQVRELVTQILDDVVPRGTCEGIGKNGPRQPANMIGVQNGYTPALWTRGR